MTEQPSQEKYGALRGIATTFIFFGWLFLLAGVIAVLVAIGMMPTRGIGSSPILAAAGGIAGIVMSLPLISAAQSIRVILDTEANTRRAADATITLIADVRELIVILNRLDYHLQRSANTLEKLTNAVVPPPIKSQR